jgi:predicted GNAT superfamily acetyltransferase
VVAAIENLVTAPDATAIAAAARIELPDELEQWKQTDPAAVKRVQDRIRSEFTAWFGRGYATIGTQQTAAGTAYLLVPWSDF